MIRLLLDQGLPRSTAGELQARCIDAVHAADIGLDRASDSDIMRTARSRKEIIVTLDADFHLLLALSGADSPSVIRIRREGLRGPEIAALVEQVLAQVGEQLDQGAMVTVTERNIRLHHLPVNRVSPRTKGV